MAHLLERLAEYDFEILYWLIRNADRLSLILSTFATLTEDEQWITLSFKTEFSNQQKINKVTSLLIEWLNNANRPDDKEMEGTF